MWGADVRRMLAKDVPCDDAVAEEPEPVNNRVVTAKYPNYVWHVDLTTVPSGYGFWVPWCPFSLPQCWPFCWWVAVAIDHTSRLVVGYAVFDRRPSTFNVCSFLKQAMHKARTRPKYIIDDKTTVISPWVPHFSSGD